jgi:hypothetical protein
MSINKTAIYYDIISEYKAKGANDATKSLGALNSLGGKLAKTLGAAFSVAAVEQFAAKSVQAFMKEEAALKILSQTLGNLGLSFKTLEVSGFITSLAESTGVMKEQLFPAFETLIRYTGDVTKAQDLLKLSLDVSAGTGKDTAAVALALGKAYGGNTVALGRLGAGLTKAELSSKNFLLVQSRLNTLFKGDAAAAADSYTGKVNRLKVAYDEMKIKIGEGIVNGLMAFSKDGSIENLTKQMDDFGTSIGNAIYGMSILLAKLDTQSGGKSFLAKLLSGTLTAVRFINPLRYLYDKSVNTALDAKSNSLSNDTYSRAKQTLVAQNATLTAKKAALAVDQKALQAAKDKAKLEKDSAVLKLAGSVFDLSQIEIVAAMTRQISDDSQLRLSLQLALLQGNADAAGKLSQKLIETQIAALQVQASDPFALMNTHILEALNSLNQLYAAMLLLNTGKKSPWQQAVDAATNSNAFAYQQQGFDVLGGTFSGSGDNALTPADQAIAAAANSFAQDTIDQGGNILGGTFGGSANGSDFFSNSSSAYNPMNGNVNITVMLDGNQVTSYINNANQNATVGGTQLSTSRINQAAIG